jgi:hypothetical protein
MVKGEIIEMVGEAMFDEKALKGHNIKFLKVDDTFEDTLEFEFIAHKLDGEQLPKRDFKIRSYKTGMEISHGLHSNGVSGIAELLMADNIQNIIVGAVSKRLLLENNY